MLRILIKIPFLPIYFCKTKIFEIFVAGPTSKNNKAAPGDNPFNTSAAAIGVVALAHTYIGIPANKIMSFATVPLKFANMFTGRK